MARPAAQSGQRRNRASFCLLPNLLGVARTGFVIQRVRTQSMHWFDLCRLCQFIVTSAQIRRHSARDDQLCLIFDYSNMKSVGKIEQKQKQFARHHVQNLFMNRVVQTKLTFYFNANNLIKRSLFIYSLLDHPIHSFDTHHLDFEVV